MCGFSLFMPLLTSSVDSGSTWQRIHGKSPPHLGKHCLWKPQRGCCENQREGPKGVWRAGWKTSSFLTAKILLSESNLDDPSKCMPLALICSLRARRTHLTYTCHPHHVSGALTPGPKQNSNTRDRSPCSQHHQWHLIHSIPQTRNLGITLEISLSCTSPHPTYPRGLPTLPFMCLKLIYFFPSAPSPQSQLLPSTLAWTWQSSPNCTPCYSLVFFSRFSHGSQHDLFKYSIPLLKKHQSQSVTLQ